VARLVVLLRGINLGPRNRIAMPALREALEDDGFDDVATYVQSGNVVLSATGAAAGVAKRCERVIQQSFGLDVDVVVRTRAQLAKVVALNPLEDVATDPKRYQVSFLSAKPAAATMRKLEEEAAPSERVVLVGREIYAWHPDGIGRSRLWARLAGRGLGVTATARNWTTVTKLLELAGS
jgi:uncharacterized protein (DUF1697 family)